MEAREALNEPKDPTYKVMLTFFPYCEPSPKIS